MLNFSVIVRGFVIILSPVFNIMSGLCWELPVSPFIIFHNALFLFLADKMSLSASLSLSLSFFFFLLLSLSHRSFDNSECTLKISWGGSWVFLCYIVITVCFLI